MSKVSTGTLNTATSYLLDGDREIAEYDGAGATLIRRYVYGPGIDEPIVRIEASGSHYYNHQDALGSVVAVSDETGVVADKYTYGVHGESGNLAGNPYRFTGRRLDPETGLYYYRARYYSASLGRFMQNDPIGYAGGDNLYGYVRNDPVNAFDPMGTEVYKLGLEGSLVLYLGSAGGAGLYYDSTTHSAGFYGSYGPAAGWSVGGGIQFSSDPEGTATNDVSFNAVANVLAVGTTLNIGNCGHKGCSLNPSLGWDVSDELKSGAAYGVKAEFGGYVNTQIDLYHENKLLTTAASRVEHIFNNSNAKSTADFRQLK